MKGLVRGGGKLEKEDVQGGHTPWVLTPLLASAPEGIASQWDTSLLAFKAPLAIFPAL